MDHCRSMAFSFLWSATHGIALASLWSLVGSAGSEHSTLGPVCLISGTSRSNREKDDQGPKLFLSPWVRLFNVFQPLTVSNTEEALLCPGR